MAFDFACPDWVARLERGETPIADLPLDFEAAEQAVDVFNLLRLPDVVGKPELAAAAGEWMRDIVRAIFGSMQTSGLGPEVRQVGEVFILVPKKNAKTTSAAAIALTFMLLNKRHHADMLIIGPTQKISDVAFEQAKGMIEADDFLSKRFQVQDHKKTILDRSNKARLMVRTFGMDVLTGAKPIFCLIDEIHVLGSIPYAADVIRQIRGGMMPFPEAVLVMITTQSDHPPAGAFKSELQYARGVRDGRITEMVRMLPVLYEFPEEMQTSKGMDWLNPEVWHMVTPNLDRSITLQRLKEGFARAKEDGQGELIAWATQHLNVEIGLALHSNRWIGADYWLEAVEPELDSLADLIARCEVIVAGIDGGGLDDLLGFGAIGRCKKTKRWLGWSRAWAHKKVLELRKDIAPHLLEFAKAGSLSICERSTQDLIEVADICEALLASGLLPDEGAIGLDPYGVASLVDELAGRGLTEKQMVAIGQGSRLSPAIWGMERKLADGTFCHDGSVMMNWVLGNARAEQRGSAVLITKETAGKAKIDPLIALLNAFMLMARNPQAGKRMSLNDFLSKPVMVV